MDPIRVTISNVFPNPMAQMNLTEDNQVIEKLPATTSDPPLRRSILPGTRRAYPLGFHAAACQNIGYLVGKFAVAIKNRIAVRTRFRKCLPQWLHYPMDRKDELPLYLPGF